MLKRSLIILLLVAVFAPGAKAGTNQRQRCSNPYTGTRHVDAMISCFARLRASQGRPIPGGEQQALAIADCESTDQPYETNGRFAGVYQIGDQEWQGWEPAGFWRWFPDAERSTRGRFSLRYSILRAFSRVRWVARQGSSAWGAWSCA